MSFPPFSLSKRPSVKIHFFETRALALYKIIKRQFANHSSRLVRYNGVLLYMEQNYVSNYFTGGIAIENPTTSKHNCSCTVCLCLSSRTTWKLGALKVRLRVSGVFWELVVFRWCLKMTFNLFAYIFVLSLGKCNQAFL